MLVSLRVFSLTPYWLDHFLSMGQHFSHVDPVLSIRLTSSNYSNPTASGHLILSPNHQWTPGTEADLPAQPDSTLNPGQAGGFITLHPASSQRPPPFGSLPTEILLKVQYYLPQSSILSLSYTCRYFSSILNVCTLRLLGQPSNWLEPQPPVRVKLPDSHCRDSSRSVQRQARRRIPSPGPKDECRDERLRLLFMLDRDFMWPGRKVCSYCCAVHDETMFSQESLYGPGTRRECLRATGVVRVCPHISLDYKQLKRTCNSPEAWEKTLSKQEPLLEARSRHRKGQSDLDAWKTRISPQQLEEAEAKRTQRRQVREKRKKEALEAEKKVWVRKTTKVCDKCSIPVVTTSWATSHVCFPIGRWIGYRPSRDELADIMRRLPIPICPHLKLSDNYILGAYSKSCTRLDSRSCKIPCECAVCFPPLYRCPICHARLSFEEGDYRSMKGVLQLVVERKFDPTPGLGDKAFVSQLESRSTGGDAEEILLLREEAGFRNATWRACLRSSIGRR